MDNEQSPPAELPTAVDGVLRAATPRAWVTPTIVGLLVASFAAATAAGIPLFSPTAGQLLEVGASFGPLLVEGQWWRILTASVLHAGLLHLAFNVLALWSVGRLTERIYGNTAFMAVYLLSAVGADLTSVAVKPLGVSVGASGAIFGVYGALLTFVLTHRGTIPREVLLRQRKSLFLFLFYNLAFALTHPSIDLAGHVGGLLTGMAAGWLLRRDLQHPTEHWTQRAAGSAGLAMLLLVGAWAVRERVVRTPEFRVEALAERAEVAVNAGDNKAAVDLCTQALAIRTDAKALFIRGAAQLRLLRPDDAAADLRASLGLQDVLETRAALCDASATASGTSSARIEVAVAECSRAIDGSAGTVLPLLQRTWLRAKQGKADEVLADVMRVLALSPNQPYALQMRAGVLLDRGSLDEAERDCAVLVKSVNPDFTPNVACAEVARRRGEAGVAVERATLVLKSLPDNLPALWLRAVAHQAAGNLDAAVTDLDRILWINAWDAEALNFRGWIRIARQDFTGGRADADRSLAARPQWATALGTRCFALVGLGDRRAARRDCAESLRLDPGNPIDQGMLAFLDGHRAEAVRLWQNAGRARPDQVGALTPWIAKAGGH